MIVRASVAGDQIGRDPEAATATLQAVAQDGRDALVETGRLLRLLRDDRDELGLQAAPIADVPPDRPAVPASRPPSARRIDRTDVMLPALFGVLSTVEIAWEGYEPLAGSIAAFWLAAGVLCLRRVLPLAMPIAVAGILAGAGALGAETYAPGTSILMSGLAMGSAGFHVPGSRAIAGLVSLSAGVALLTLQASAEGDLSDVVLQVAFVAPWAVGVGVRRALDRARELAADAERARIERELEAERGAAAERRRIARDLHDTLAKSLSVMIVQASLAADLARDDPRSAESAIAEVERSGRSAIAELAGLLRLAGAGPAGTEPQRGVADLPALADEYARAGLAVDLEIDDAVSRLPIGVELSTYRIVQEALTNALKHAPGSGVRVTFGRRGASYAIAVRNGRAATATVAAATSGHGLIGVRERVSLFGGNLDAGPTPDGGFELVATLSAEGEAA
jgi:signal transduction histidine kinase